MRKALTCRAFFTSCFKEVGIGTSLRQNTELDESFFSVQNIYSFIATSNGESTSFYAYAMTAITHCGAVRKLEQLFALGSTHNSRAGSSSCFAASPCSDKCLNFGNVLASWPLL